ncbi:hypothetical protein [Streptomyces albidoflavus]|uniref:hypothetical protein n=1 Tax=Streptomyces albidoflavus TaxID=1886 RepID=UPI00332A78DA
MPTTDTQQARIGDVTGPVCEDCAEWCDGNIVEPEDTGDLDMVGITSRTITLTGDGQTRTIPADTKVYCTPITRGLRVRLPGTLLTQDVEGDAIRVP